ncbi:MAG TPA: hypothetical protein PKN36_02340 [bacterium]|nr:hypothetical protein [bacterium]
MPRLIIDFADNSVIEKIYESRKGRRKIINIDNHCNIEEDDEVLPVNRNFEERLQKGFKILDMAKNGYPADG